MALEVILQLSFIVPGAGALTGPPELHSGSLQIHKEVCYSEPR